MDTVGTEASPVITELKEAFQVDEDRVKSFLEEKMRGTIEEMMNQMLDAEADALCQAQKYQRTAERQTTRSGSYQRKLHTTVGEVNLKMPRLRSLPFETQIIERYRRRQSSVEESLMEMFLAGVSVRRVEDITERSGVCGSSLGWYVISIRRCMNGSKRGGTSRSRASTRMSIWMAFGSSGAGVVR